MKHLVLKFAGPAIEGNATIEVRDIGSGQWNYVIDTGMERIERSIHMPKVSLDTVYEEFKRASSGATNGPTDSHSLTIEAYQNRESPLFVFGDRAVREMFHGNQTLEVFYRQLDLKVLPKMYWFRNFFPDLTNDAYQVPSISFGLNGPK